MTPKTLTGLSWFDKLSQDAKVPLDGQGLSWYDKVVTRCQSPGKQAGFVMV
jgi:hypothetical protein